MTHVVDGNRSIGVGCGIVVAVVPYWVYEAKKCGERLHLLEDEGVGCVGDQSSPVVDLFADLK